MNSAVVNDVELFRTILVATGCQTHDYDMSSITDFIPYYTKERMTDNPYSLLLHYVAFVETVDQERPQEGGVSDTAKYQLYGLLCYSLIQCLCQAIRVTVVDVSRKKTVTIAAILHATEVLFTEATMKKGIDDKFTQLSAVLEKYPKSKKNAEGRKQMRAELSEVVIFPGHIVDRFMRVFLVNMRIAEHVPLYVAAILTYFLKRILASVAEVTNETVIEWSDILTSIRADHGLYSTLVSLMYST
jgi:hypothetical protein